jgi:hypothetical protein
LQVAALDCAGQTVREQLGEPCRIVECAAFSEKCCAVEQFGCLSHLLSSEAPAVYVEVWVRIGDEKTG